MPTIPLEWALTSAAFKTPWLLRAVGENEGGRTCPHSSLAAPSWASAGCWSSKPPHSSPECHCHAVSPSHASPPPIASSLSAYLYRQAGAFLPVPSTLPHTQHTFNTHKPLTAPKDEHMPLMLSDIGRHTQTQPIHTHILTCTHAHNYQTYSHTQTHSHYHIHTHT